MRATVSLFGLAALLSCLLWAPSSAAASSFSVECPLSHRLNDDPILFPALPGAAHRHGFYGATGANASSTPAQLRRGRTSCTLQRDTASYWAPELSVRGTQVRGTLTAYYSRGGKARAAAFPRNLKVIAGDMMAVRPQSKRVTWWSCTGKARGGQRLARVPSCRTGERLTGWVGFPDCWDGRHLDSSDHRSHLAYSVRGRCPGPYPAPLMKLIVRIAWGARPRPGDVRLGGALPATAMHADFWNTWHQPTLDRLRWECVETTANCGLLRG